MNGLTCFKAPIVRLESFLDILLICVDQEKGFSNCVSPRELEELTLMISFPLICARKEAPAWVCSL